MKKFKDLAAQLLSRVLDPVWEIPLVILLAVAFAASEGLRWRFLGLLLFIDAVVPMIFFLIMLMNKQIKDWDIQQRQQRVPLYMFTLLCHLVGLWLAFVLGKAELFLILSVFYGLGILFVLITLRWKISLHAGVNAVLFTVINMFYGWHYVWMFVILVAVMWARVYQKHHSVSQVIAGALLGGGMVGVGLGVVL